MTDADKLKSTWSSIFRRKGANGRYTRLFQDLDASQRALMMNQVQLNADELPVIGSAESSETWLVLTTQRIVWRLKGQNHTLSIHDVWHVKADLPKMVATGTRKNQLRELQIETLNHDFYPIEVEEGAPLFGVWNALLNLGARNRRKP